MKGFDLKTAFSKYQRVFIFLVIVLVMTVLQPRAFPTTRNFSSILLAISVYGIMVCGTIFVVLLGGIDLSVASLSALCGMVCVKVIVTGNYTAASVILGILAGVAVGALCGVMHGFIIAYLNVPAFLLTYATSSMFKGAAQMLGNNSNINCLNSPLFSFIGGGRFLGVPMSVWIMLLFALISWFILNKTLLGRQVYAVGGNREAAGLSGVSNRRIIFTGFAFSGITAAAAGIVLASMLEMAAYYNATGYESNVMTAIIVGGGSMLGGVGTVQGALLGALLVGTVNNGMTLMSVPSAYHDMIMGIVVIIAVAADAFKRYKDSGLSRSILPFGRKKARAKGDSAP